MAPDAPRDREVVADQPVRVLVVDDHRTFADALAARLDAEPDVAVVGVATTVPRAMVALDTLRPDLLLVDFRLGTGTAMEILTHLRDVPSPPTTLVLSGAADPAEVVACLEAGALGWVSKDVDVPELLTAVDDALAGLITLPPSLAGPVIQELLGRRAEPPAPPSFLDDLTPRQRDVLGALLAGFDRGEIAHQLVLSPHTVRTHIQELLTRSGSHSTLELLARARSNGAVTLLQEDVARWAERRRSTRADGWPE